MAETISSVIDAYLDKTGTPVGVFIKQSGVPTPSYYRIRRTNSCNLPNWRKLCLALGLPEHSPPPVSTDVKNR